MIWFHTICLPEG